MTKHHEGCACCSEGREAFQERLEKIIREVGHAVITTGSEIAEGTIAMAYTMGLSDQGLPELLLFGIGGEPAMEILNTAADMLRSGELPVDVPVEKLLNLPIVVKAVPPEAAAEYIVQANGRAGRQLPALQLVWPDPEGRFAWEPQFDEGFRFQPAPYEKRQVLH
ncbi:DUF4262 domain-containing protein [Pseudomonas aeruginosa]|uniref:DUF4262 domain-containing protein n=1 Tax=Pseudomonas aeruginosa TaxID=287 RepID=UPI00287FD62A|nr:DUF4262 domain-containing protein [Pseudomonas aeruginosa]